MFRSRRHLSVLLAGLLLLQALAVAHAFDHPVGQHADHDCVACPHGHGGGALPSAETGTALTAPAHGPERAVDTRPPAVSPARGYRSRAPPLPSLHHG
ncbi:hypothetical protein PC39_14237 [Salinisphaera sp. PC39]|uniref:hypothetical protein n=1 Tax=Salinisphaera sp. PC39 TaxID=1304156 RepID=UPI0033420A77